MSAVSVLPVEKTGTHDSDVVVQPIDPRETMRALPAFLQLPLTLLTGKPLVGQRPLRLSPTHHLLASTISLGAGVALGLAGLHAGGLWLLLLVPSWAMTLHAMRNVRMMLFHQCSHRNMYTHPLWDAVIGRAISSLLVVQSFGSYSREHVADHHSIHHMTLRDPTVQALLRTLQLRPGMSRRQMWRQIVGKMLSPRFHASFAVARVRAFLHESTTGERIAAAVIYAVLLAATAVTGSWLAFVLVWLVPLVPLFQLSNTLRLCVKHTFPAPDVTERRGKAYYASLTNAIFLGEPAPPEGAGAGAWLRWFARMLFVHFPSRYLVLTGDTVVHDYHHRHPSSKRWYDYIFVRQQDVENGHPGWPPYREAWGLVPAMNLVFDSLSVADPDEYDVDKIGAVSGRDLFNAFDD